MFIYADADGCLMRVLKTDDEIAQYGPPGSYAEELEIDADTNPQILQRIDTAWNDVRLVGGMLTYKGAPIAVNPPGPTWLVQAETIDAKSRILTAIDAALTDYAAALERWDVLTAAQQKAVLRRLVEVQAQLLRYHRREWL